MILQSLVLLAVQTQFGALDWRGAPRRDIGRVQATIGQAESVILPRTELVGTPPGTTLAGPGQPVPNLELAQGPRRDLGASVPFAPPGENLPPAALTPLPPDYRDRLPGPAIAGSAAVPTAPATVAVPGPQAAAIPAAPAQVAAPLPFAQAIPVVFASPTTGSSFIPAGSTVAVAPGGLPANTVVSAAPGVVPLPAASQGMQLAPTAGPPPGLAGGQQENGFLSDNSMLDRFELRPRVGSTPAGASGGLPGPAGRRSAPTSNEPSIPIPSAMPERAKSIVPPAEKPAEKPPEKPKEKKLELPPPPTDTLPSLDETLPLPKIP